jgi:hypothetical protein
MTVARVTEISATSPLNFEDAIRSGVARANETLRNVRSAWIKEQQVAVQDGDVAEFRVNLLVTFVLDEPGSPPNKAIQRARPARGSGTR